MKIYNKLSRLNHWSVAIFFMVMLIAGLTLEYGGLSKADNFTLLKFHKAMGVLLFLWGLWRVGYRLVQGFAEPVSIVERWQQIASKAIHNLLLLAVVMMPVSGLVMALFSGYPTDVFGLVTIPSIEKIDSISMFARSVHKWVAYVFITALFLHIGAALKHHFINRDQTLTRMIFGKIQK